MKSEERFLAWMRLVDKAIRARCGLSLSDLPDWRYRDAFEERMSPAKVAREVLREEGFE